MIEYNPYMIYLKLLPRLLLTSVARFLHQVCTKCNKPLATLDSQATV